MRNNGQMLAQEEKPKPSKPPKWADSVDQLQVCGNLILIKEHVPGSSAGGIALPDDYREDGPRRGTVVQIGPGLLRDDGTRTIMESKVGEQIYVVFGRGTMCISIGRDTYHIVPDDSIIARVQGEP